MRAITDADVARMREQLFFDGHDFGRKVSRFWLLLTLSAVIASAGVVSDSTATVIGAMIVAPLMIPILGTVVAVVLADRTNLLRSMGFLVSGALSVIAISWLLGHLIGNPVVASTNSQVASRVTPHLVDLVAALATGAVGSIALARDDISDTLPGVAIAISLVPPLAVVGLTLESGAPDQALGALVLFLTNVTAILATGLVVMGIYRVQRRAATVADDGHRPVHRGRAVAIIVLSLVVICIPLTITGVQVSTIASNESTATSVATRWADSHGWELVSVTSRPTGVLVRVTGPLPEPDTDGLRTALDEAGLGGTTVKVEMIPSHTVDVSPGS